jgi:predicted nucleic acid-binding protein
MSVDFLDSNIFIYSVDESDARKYQIARGLLAAVLENGEGAISFQVVQETLNVLTQKLPVPATIPDAKRFLDSVLVPLWQVYPSAALYARAVDLQGRYRFSFYDSLIVAAALEASCSRLLTEDLQHGQRIDGLTVENPFRAEFVGR